MMLSTRKLLVVIGFLPLALLAQQPEIVADTTASQNHSSPFVSGYYPIGFFDVDLKYLIKYNNYESFRLGFGGITNDRLSKRFKLNGYLAYGFKDAAYKYSVGANIRLSKSYKTWLGLDYVKDIQEIGNFTYLTNQRIYSVFEPRLINITQFYKLRGWNLRLGMEPSQKIMADVLLSRHKINQIESYTYLNDGTTYSDYYLTEATVSVRVAPKTLSLTTDDKVVEYYDGLPKISVQVTKGIKGIAKSNFDYWKLGLKLDYFIKREDLSSSHLVMEGIIGFGDIPLTHLFHAYPNNPTKDEILQRFSVAGRQSFETMYFGEFFSDRLITFRGKHTLRRFDLGEKWKPELVLITRHAIGNLWNPEKHIGLEFDTLDEFYSETGFELNRILFGFGLSFAYRYGFYHLPKTADNVSFKFTFNLKL